MAFTPDTSNPAAPNSPLNRTALYDLHRELGAKFVPFAGYDMPVQYPLGVLGEHLHTRAKAGLFDVSHMGQLRIEGANAADMLETLVPGDIRSVKPMRMRYTLLTNEHGGIRDDLMVTNRGDHLFLVVNAGTKQADIAYLKARIGGKVTLTPLPDQALLALQGPQAASVMARLAPSLSDLGFMSAAEIAIEGIACFVTRSGYTGEDGYEISVANEAVPMLAKLLLAESEVAAIGLGARDSLRLEAGLCLHGHDIDETINPIEADLAWTIQKRRRAEGGFVGSDIILDQLKNGARRKRVGILPEGRAPAREGTEILAAGETIGIVTSGGFGPTQGGPVAMGYVATEHAVIGTKLTLKVRGRELPATVSPLPFVPHRYYRAR